MKEEQEVKLVKWMCDSCCEEFTGTKHEEHCPVCMSHKIFKI
jgi:rubrerythrin